MLTKEGVLTVTLNLIQIYGNSDVKTSPNYLEGRCLSTQEVIN